MAKRLRPRVPAPPVGHRHGLGTAASLLPAEVMASLKRSCEACCQERSALRPSSPSSPLLCISLSAGSVTAVRIEERTALRLPEPLRRKTLSRESLKHFEAFFPLPVFCFLLFCLEARGLHLGGCVGGQLVRVHRVPKNWTPRTMPGALGAPGPKLALGLCSSLVARFVTVTRSKK